MPMAPTEDQAIAALKRVQSMSPDEFESKLHSDLGQPMLAVFNALARVMHPDDDEEQIAKKLHLMMLAWFMAR